MPFTVTIHHGRPHLLGTLSGPCGLADLCGAADFFRALAIRAGYRRLLVDMQETQPSLSFTEHILLGGHIAEVFDGLDRVATVVRPADRVGTSEKAAQNYGLKIRTYTDLTEAEAWIVEGQDLLAEGRRALGRPDAH